MSTPRRRLPVGAEPVGGGRTHVRVWAPAARRVEVVLADGPSTSLTPEDAGYFSGLVGAGAGQRYRFRLDGGGQLYPDPASRFQPEGPHAWSEIVDPTAFAWTDAAWPGLVLEGQVFYELHVGTFTREGTWRAALAQLPELAALGVTVVEVMPVAEFDGRFGWGYDGVDLFAPFHGYGCPDDFRRFVDAAHAAGLGVVLDVVCNHLGPVGNYLRAFAPQYFTDRYENEWGEAINFDGPDAGPVREFFLANAAYWIDEFHLDGLRLDATQQIFDASSDHIVAALTRQARRAAGTRRIVVVAENERQDVRLAADPADGGYGVDGLWNDDFHHAALVALTGRAEAYYSDMRGEPQEFVSAAKRGYLFQGQHYEWQHQPRGTPAWGVPPAAFVVYLQNHDQVANTSRGLRGHELTSPGRWRAMTALLLLAPGTPLLFQGQEFSSSAPFLYMADFEAEVAASVRTGRAEFLAQFPSLVDFEAKAPPADPGSPATFERCKLDFSERAAHAGTYALHRDLLLLRREHVALGMQRPGSVDGAVLSASAFVLRLMTPGHRQDRLLIVNLGADLGRPSLAEPLVAPPAGADWMVRWSSEEPAYGGGGTPDPWPGERWHIPAESALVFMPGPIRRRDDARRRRTA